MNEFDMGIQRINSTHEFAKSAYAKAVDAKPCARKRHSPHTAVVASLMYGYTGRFNPAQAL
jgi:hypothetical protein